MNDDEYNTIILRAIHGISDTPPEDMIPNEEKHLAAVQWLVSEKTRDVWPYVLTIHGWVYREHSAGPGKTRTTRDAVIDCYRVVQFEPTVEWYCEPGGKIAPSEWMLMDYDQRSVMVSDNWVPIAEVEASVLQKYDEWQEFEGWRKELKPEKEKEIEPARDRKRGITQAGRDALEAWDGTLVFDNFRDAADHAKQNPGYIITQQSPGEFYVSPPVLEY